MTRQEPAPEGDTRHLTSSRVTPDQVDLRPWFRVGNDLFGPYVRKYSFGADETLEMTEHRIDANGNTFAVQSIATGHSYEPTEWRWGPPTLVTGHATMELARAEAAKSIAALRAGGEAYGAQLGRVGTHVISWTTLLDTGDLERTTVRAHPTEIEQSIIDHVHLVPVADGPGDLRAGMLSSTGFAVGKPFGQAVRDVDRRMDSGSPVSRLAGRIQRSLQRHGAPAELA